MAHKTRRRLVKAIARLPRCRNCGLPILHADQRRDSTIGKWCHTEHYDFDPNPMDIPAYYPSERLY